MTALPDGESKRGTEWSRAQSRDDRHLRGDGPAETRDIDEVSVRRDEVGRCLRHGRGARALVTCEAGNEADRNPDRQERRGSEPDDWARHALSMPDGAGLAGF